METKKFKMTKDIYFTEVRAVKCEYKNNCKIKKQQIREELMKKKIIKEDVGRRGGKGGCSSKEIEKEFTEKDYVVSLNKMMKKQNYFY